MSVLSEPHFHNEEAAYARLEAIVWPNGPVCPHCGNADPERVYAIKGKTARIGLRTCAECREQFRVTVGTVFEKSKIPLHKWFQAAHLLASSKKGISSHQLHRTLRVTYKTAWFMAHRLREAMRVGPLAPMGGEGKIVEADETFIGRKHRVRKARAGTAHKVAVLALVERGGSLRSMVIEKTNADILAKHLHENVARESRLMTDTASYYHRAGFANHETVNHNIDEYVRGDAHTNTLESYFSVFKKGMKGVYQHCAEKHVHRYLAEFDFRYNNRVALGVEDTARTTTALRGIVGKRLTYRDSSAP
jgi:transposase-like protein